LARKNRKKSQEGVRIIAGQWRGRRLPVPDIKGLRPSGDRSRETLFNWLQPSLHNARCLDLFAGTGVLGLEAASRGAAEVTLLEKSPVAIASLKESVELLKANQVRVIRADAMAWLAQQPGHSVDVVFVDPPFAQSLTQAVLEQLTETNIVSPGGLVYLETARTEDIPVMGPSWMSLKEKIMGEVRMQLFKKI